MDRTIVSFYQRPEIHAHSSKFVSTLSKCGGGYTNAACGLLTCIWNITDWRMFGMVK